MREVQITKLLRDEGTIVVFAGVDLVRGGDITIAVDHRPAQDIVNALRDHEVNITADVEDWQILSQRANPEKENQP